VDKNGAASSHAPLVDAVNAGPPASLAASLPPVVSAVSSISTPAVVPTAVATAKVPTEMLSLPIDAEKVEEVVTGDSKRRRLKRVVEEE
jgi:hypothetical protein